jgi:hypothetical protein
MKNRIVKRFIKAPLPAKCLSVFGWLFQPEMQVSQAEHQKKHGLPAKVVVTKGQAGGYFEISLLEPQDDSPACQHILSPPKA